jgi:hypothetical protein
MDETNGEVADSGFMPRQSLHAVHCLLILALVVGCREQAAPQGHDASPSADSLAGADDASRDSRAIEDMADAAAADAGPCVDPGLQVTGPANVRGQTPVGEFVSAGARAFGQCLWIDLASVDQNGCLKQTLTVVTNLVVPPWPRLDRTPMPVTTRIRAEGIRPTGEEGTGTLILEEEVTDGGRMLRGQLSVQTGRWSLEGSFAAPWQQGPECK